MAFADQRVLFAWQTVDHLRQVQPAQRLIDTQLLLRVVFTIKQRDVLQNAGIEQDVLLALQEEQLLCLTAADRLSVGQDFSALRFDKSGNDFQQRTFPRARLTDNRQRFAMTHRHRHVIQHRFTRIVSKLKFPVDKLLAEADRRQ